MIGHFPVRIAEMDPVSIKRCAQRAPGVTGSRRDKHAFETGLSQDAYVGYTVQRDAASQAEIGKRSLPVQSLGQLYQCVSQNLLDAGSTIGPTLVIRRLQIDWRVRVA